MPIEPHDQPLKIALLSDWFLPRMGGIEVHLGDLARELAARGHEVQVITSTRGAPVHEGVRVHRLALPMIFGAIARPDFSRLAILRRLFSREKFDVVHAHGMASSVAIGGIIMAHHLGVPSVKTNHSMLHCHPFYRPVARAIFAFWVKDADVLTAVSAAAAADVRSVCGRDEVLVLSNGIDRTKWTRGSEPTGEVRFASVMRLHSRKEPMDLVRAVPGVLKEAKQPVRFSIIGDGPERDRLEAEAHRLGVAERIEFLGARPRVEVPEFLAQSDVFVLPGRNEGFGIAALEARCARLPVVAMKSGGLEDVIEHDRHGLLARSNAEFAAHLVRMANEPELRARLAAQTGTGLERFGWDAVIARHMEVYRLAIARRRGKTGGAA